MGRGDVGFIVYSDEVAVGVAGCLDVLCVVEGLECLLVVEFNLFIAYIVVTKPF